MLLTGLRFVFILLVAAVAMRIAEYCYQVMPALAILFIALGAACLLIALDVFIPQKSLLAVSAVFFGLVVGLFVTFLVGLVLDSLILVLPFRDALRTALEVNSHSFQDLVALVKVLIGVICCYMSVSLVLQTKDDIRFIIPYVEFVKQRKGEHPLVLDTSVIIDGRITDILESWRVDAPVIVPRFVLQELQAVADSNDKLKRNRGRRGLDVVNKLQGLERIDLQFQETRGSREEEREDVDQKLVSLARKIDGRLVTNDYNLNKVAQIRGVEVININDLANALKPVFLPGESMQVKIIKPGEEPGQGVGYLEDGTMIVVEAARERIGQTVSIMVTSVLQTSAGRMVFGRMSGGPAPAERPRRRQGPPGDPAAT
jgi:uncharacterized protein YacL